jgi:hypothetical protein
MDRKEELLEIINHDRALVPLVDEMVYLEEQLAYLRGLPKLKVHPENPELQKATPAAKLYREMLQQYTIAVRILMKATGRGETEEESPLRRYLNEMDG